MPQAFFSSSGGPKAVDGIRTRSAPELGAEGVIEIRYVFKTAIKRHVENLGRTICQARAEVFPSRVS